MARKRSVLHLIPSLDCGGAEMMLHKLLSYIDRSRTEHFIVSMLDNGSLVDQFKQLGVPVFGLGMQYGVPNPFGFLKLLRILRQLRPCILQSWMYPCAILGLLAGRLTGVRAIIWSIRCSGGAMIPHSLLSRFTLRSTCTLSRYADLILFNSESGAIEHRIMGFRNKSTRVIPNGFDLGLFEPNPKARAEVRAMLGIPERAAVVGLIARYHPTKDHTTFLRAAAHVVNRIPHAWFLLAGANVDPANAEITSQLSALNLTGCSTLVGLRNDIHRILHGIDTLALSSISEGFPNVLGEAMACGIPCVATRVGDIARILGDTGMVVSSGDPLALADALTSMLLRSPDERSILGAQARRRVIEHFSIESIAREYGRLFDSVGWQREN